MNIFYELDIAAVVLTILLFIIFLIRKSYPTVSRRMFKYLIASSALSAGLEIILCLIRNGTIPATEFWRDFAFSVFYLVHVTLHYIFLFYVTSSSRGILANKTEKIVFSIIYVALVVFIGTNFLHHYAFAFDAQGNAIYVFGLTIIEGVGALSLIYALIVTIRSRKRMTNLQFGLDIFFLFMWAASMIVETLVLDVYVENFCIAVTVLLVTVVTDNPDKYFYAQTGVYNVETFNLVYGEKLSKGIPFKIVCLAFKDFELYIQKVGLKRANVAIFESLKHLRQDYGVNNVFSLKRNIAVIDARIFESEEKLQKECVRIAENCYRSGLEHNPDCKLNAQFAVFECPKDCDNLADLSTAINMMLFDPEVRGDDLVQYFEPSLLDARHRREKIIMKIHEAIENDGFEMYYQPLYDWKKDRYIGLEALIRFKDKDLGFGPGEFIPIAEQEGLIFDIDEIVFEKVCRFIRNNDIRKYGLNFIDINLSLLKLLDEDTIERYTELASRYDVDPGFINLEITETAEANEKYLNTVRANIAKFREKGFAFSLDDYGSGYSTVVYMAEMDVKMVKIDASILWNAMNNKKYYTVLENCVRLIYCFDKDCLCEGVEDEKMVEMLKRLGVDYFQGYYFSKPVNEADIVEMLKKKNGVGSIPIKSRSKLI